MGWVYLTAAGLLEVVWPLGLKYSHSMPMWAATVLVIVVNFYFLAKAYEYLPAGTTYTVFAGIGTLGLFCVDAFIIKVEVSVYSFVFIMFILVGIIGLKLVTKDDK